MITGLRRVFECVTRRSDEARRGVGCLGTITIGARKGAEQRVQNSDRDSSRRLRSPPYC